MSEIINTSIFSLRKAYAENSLTPQKVMAFIRQKSAEYADRNIWIHVLSEAEQQPYLDALALKDPASHPLWGIPFAIKDNIDLAGVTTTVGCKEFAYTPVESAQVVQQLIDAGAIPTGKTNLDQFATGLNGTRSPWGACKNAFKPDYISGGSSAGSAVAVALGLASFSLGTDTAGSGRVPACFNNLLGVKPSRGLLSATGMVPACRSLDCMTIFAYDSDEAEAVLSVAEGYDARDAYSRKNPYLNLSRHYGERAGRLKIGVLADDCLDFFGDENYAAAYKKTLEVLEQNNVELIEIDYSPFDQAAKLLYEGPWVAERYISTQPLIEENPDAMFPVVRDIIQPGGDLKAVHLFAAQYRLNALKTVCDEQLSKLDCLLTPTAGSCFTIQELLAEPIVRNSQLGYYTNFMNLLDYASVAMPTMMTAHGLPFGVTLVSQAFSDRALLSIVKRLQPNFELSMGALNVPKNTLQLTPVNQQKYIDVLVCGAHLTDQPLNWQLTERGGFLKKATQTAPVYRMYALAGGPPYRPGLIYDEQNGAAIEVEVWSVPTQEFGSFVAGIPSPLGIGKVFLDDGTMTNGFICESYGIDGATEITHLGSWLKFLEQLELQKINVTSNG